MPIAIDRHRGVIVRIVPIALSVTKRQTRIMNVQRGILLLLKLHVCVLFAESATYAYTHTHGFNRTVNETLIRRIIYSVSYVIQMACVICTRAYTYINSIRRHITDE